VRALDRAGEVAERRDGHADLPAGGGDRLARVARLEDRQLLVVVLHDGDEALQEPRAVARGDRAPRREGGLGPRDGGVDLLGAGARDGVQNLLGGGLQDLERGRHVP
jgi:hypothetical protein